MPTRYHYLCINFVIKVIYKTIYSQNDMFHIKWYVLKIRLPGANKRGNQLFTHLPQFFNEFNKQQNYLKSGEDDVRHP